MRAALRVPIYVANEAIELELGIFKISLTCTKHFNYMLKWIKTNKNYITWHWNYPRNLKLRHLITDKCY